MKSPFSLEGKTALVTGGNQGLGKAFALCLAQAGARGDHAYWVRFVAFALILVAILDKNRPRRGG